MVFMKENNLFCEDWNLDIAFNWDADWSLDTAFNWGEL